MYITKSLNKYLSALFSDKKNGVYYSEIKQNCYMLAKVYKENNYSVWDSEFTKLTVHNGFNFYDIRFCIVLCYSNDFNPSDYSLDYSLCAVCGKKTSEWAIKADSVSTDISDDIEKSFYETCYAPVFEEKTDLYNWIKNVSLSVYGENKLLIDELYFLYDMAVFFERDDEKAYWNECIENL